MGIEITSPLPTVGSQAEKDLWGDEENAWKAEVVAKLAALSKAEVGLGNVENVDTTDRGNLHGTQPSASIDGLTEAVQDVIGSTLVAGTSLSIAYNDTAGTVTISLSGALPTIDIFWDGTGTCPTRASSGAVPAQHVNWASPVGNPIPAGAPYALEQDSWDAE